MVNTKSQIVWGLHGLIMLSNMYLVRRIYIKHVTGTPFMKTDLTGKVFVITGSNAGIGFETTRQIIAMNGTVVMACRSLDKGGEARKLILDEFKCSPSKLVLLKLDLCSFDSVRKFVKEFHNLGLPLHVLLNNAGVMIQNRSVTQDGLEMVITANHLSHFLLTNLLLPDLEKTSGRVVTLTSSTHHLVRRFEFEDVMAERHYELFKTYAQSKLANILFTKELQRRITASGGKVKCFSLHPGCVRTEVTRNMSSFMQIGNMLAAPIMMTLQKTPAQGAYCSVHVATAPELSGLQGGDHFFHCRPAGVSEAANNSAAASTLWDLSEKLTGWSSHNK